MSPTRQTDQPRSPVRRTLVAAAGVLIALAPCVRADDADLAVAEFLEENALHDLLAVQLRAMLGRESGDARLDLAERLARLYAQQLESAQSGSERATLERHAGDLLESVPEAETSDLRLGLAVARYLPAESIAERHRLRLADADERREAEQTLRTVRDEFARIADHAAAQVRQLEPRERAARGDDRRAVRERLADARRVRSMASYYAGWAGYYHALLSETDRGLDEAAASFALLFDPTGRPVTMERLPRAMLRYDHMARAALGLALVRSARGDHTGARHWLESVAEAEELAEVAREQLFVRRVTVYARAGLWTELAGHVDRRRRGGRPLELAEARLLAVSAMERMARDTLPRLEHEAARRLAEQAISDLVERQELAHVLDLVDRYGAMPLGDTGFVVTYVRARRAYDQARTAHERESGPADEPATQPDTINRYAEAAGLFRHAFGAQDADAFVRERARAGLLAGLSRYYAGRFTEAAAWFERAYNAAERVDGAAAHAEEALWFAVVALERADGPEAGERRDRLSLLFLERYPRSDRAARLLLRRADTALLSDDDTLEILLAVEPGSPVYGAARRHAARLLYRMFRASTGSDRAAAADRFLEIAAPLNATDLGEIRGGDPRGGAEAFRSLLGRARQVLDVALAVDPARTDEARHALDAIETAARRHDLGDLGPELGLRRVQLALAERDRDRADGAAEALVAEFGRDNVHARAARAIVFRDAAEQWRRARPAERYARRVIRVGLPMLSGDGEDADDRAVREYVADAAAAMWERDAEEEMLRLAVRLDRRSLRSGPTMDALERLSRLAETAGDIRLALDAWRVLQGRTDRDDPAWFEARYHVIRLLIELDPDEAARVLEQHGALHPGDGPEPWGERIGALRRELAPRQDEPEGDE